MLGDVDERIWVSTGVGCVEISLELLCIEAGGVLDAEFIHRSGKVLNRHGILRLRRQGGAVLCGGGKVSAAFQTTTSDN